MKKRMKKISALCLAGMLCLGLWACSSSEDGSSEGSSSSDSSGTTKQESSENGFPVNMPEFSTTDMDGNKVTNDIFADYDLTVVNFWATYCNPCIDELPELAEWKKELPNNVNLIGLLVDVDEKGSDQYKLSEKIIKETGADYQHLIATEEFDDIISKNFAYSLKIINICCNILKLLNIILLIIRQRHFTGIIRRINMT